MIKKINILIITMFGIGNSRYAPGTVASFVTCLVYIFFYTFEINIIFLVFFLTITFVYSVYVIDVLIKNFSEIDAKEIVIDEFIGQSIPALTIYAFLEKSNLSHFILYIMVSFILFRIFDILKPYPINRIDKNMKNGFGVILDDIVAGIFSVIVLLILILLMNFV